MEIRTYQYSDCGSRSNNEDFAQHSKTEDGKGVYVLADGLGGHSYGEVASRLAVEFTIAEAMRCSEFSNESLLQILNGSNLQILQVQRENDEYNSMRTTVVAAFADISTVRYYNVGDSRFYYFKDNKIIKQSKDHSVSQVAVDMGEILPSQIRFNADRNKLLKVLGDTERLKISAFDGPIQMTSGDAFLLCSDGFWENVLEVEMEIDLCKANTPKEWLEYMVKRILLRVHGDYDNFTAICSIVS